MSRRVCMISSRGADVVKFGAPNGSQQVIVFLAGLAQIRRQWKLWEKGMVEGEEQKAFMPLFLRVVEAAAGGWLACWKEVSLSLNLDRKEVTLMEFAA